MPLPAVGGDWEGADEDAAAAGLSTTQSAPHWDTGVPFSEPASHSSFPSRMPLPQEGTDDADSDDAKREDTEDEDASDDDAADSLLSELYSDDASEEVELVTDAREKKRMEESCDDEESMLKLQSGRRNGMLDRTGEDEDALMTFVLGACKEEADEVTAAAEDATGRKG